MSDHSESQTNPEPSLVHWVDTTGVTREPVSAEVLLGWIDGGHLPMDTPTWWDGLDGWTTATQLRAPDAAHQGFGRPAAEDVAPPSFSVDSDTAATPAAPVSMAQPPEQEATLAAAASATPPSPEVTSVEPQLDGTESGESSAFTQGEAATSPEPTAPPSPVQEDPAPPPEPIAPPPQLTEHAGAPPEPNAQVQAAGGLTGSFADQDLDDTFMHLVSRSSDIYKESERATSMDEVFLGGVIAAFGDSGYVLIDIFTGGSLRSTGSASAAAQMTTPVHRHELRFEDPTTGARVAVVLDHLTPDVGSAKILGQRARIELGYGQKVPNFGQVGRALRQEMASTFVVSPEPGRVTFDADLSSGFVYCQVDLLWELDRYVDESMDVNADLLRKHLAANVHTMRKFLQLRFGD